MGSVIFALGMAGPERGSLPGPVLVALLGTLGIGERAARATILRMRRDGRLASVRNGRVVEYALTAPSLALSAEVLTPVIGPRPAWSGLFHGLLFSIPERRRSYRDALRRAALLAGFGALRPGLLVATEDRRWRRLDPILASAPPESRLLRVELRLALDDARLAAAEAWPLEALAQRYRRHLAQVERVTGEASANPPRGAAAVRATWDTMQPLFATATEDPGLPDELLPRDWPGEAMRQALVDFTAVVSPGVRGHLDRLLGAYPLRA